MESTRDYISVEQSIINSLIEVKMMQAGLLPKPTLEDFFSHIEEIIKEEEENANNSDQKVQ